MLLLIISNIVIEEGKLEEIPIQIVAIDECLFPHDQKNIQIWVVDSIETDTKKLILDIIHKRNSTNLEKFVINHFEPGTKIVTDCWAGYTFLDNSDEMYGSMKHLITVMVISAYVFLLFLISKEYGPI